MNETTAQQIITARDIWELFLRRLVIILLVTALSVGIFYVYNKVTYVPMYQSTATLYIAGEDSFPGSSSADAYNTYSLALKVVNDCNYLLSSRSVLDQVIAEKQLPTSYSILQGRISTNNPTSTRILEVTVEAESPGLSKLIVDSVCEIGETKINEVMGANYVQLYEHGTKSNIPCNITPKSTYIIVGAISAILCFCLCLLLYLLDDRIRSAEALEQVLGLSVLGDIPDNTGLNQKSRYGYYGVRKGYRAYAPYSNRSHRPYGGNNSTTQKSSKKGKV